jgi:hypothetical protein
VLAQSPSELRPAACAAANWPGAHRKGDLLVLSVVFDQPSSVQNQGTEGGLDIAVASGKFHFFLNSQGF